MTGEGTLAVEFARLSGMIEQGMQDQNRRITALENAKENQPGRTTSLIAVCLAAIGLVVSTATRVF